VHIAILIGRFPPGVIGGAELQAESWAKRLSDRHHVTVVTRVEPGGRAGREPRDGFEVVRVPVSRVPLVRTLADLSAIDRALRALTPQPDLLLCFQTFISGLAGVRTGRVLGVPAIVWIRGEEEYRLAGRKRLVNPGVWAKARGVLVQSEQNRLALLRELEAHAPAHVAVVREKLEVVPNGLDLPDGPFPPGTGVLSVGRLITDKGMDTVIDAAAAAGEPLTIAGDGPERAALEARARTRGARCTFTGFASREQLAPLFAGAGCFVLASRRGEGLPNVLLEAMARGRPIVATACAGTLDLVVDGVNGLLVPADDPIALAGALRRLRGEPTLAARLGAEARRTVEAFRWDAVREQLEAVLVRGSTA
jgi:glycosyltransferase involved in cell wall biosynthesis